MENVQSKFDQVMKILFKIKGGANQSETVFHDVLIVLPAIGMVIRTDGIKSRDALC